MSVPLVSVIMAVRNGERYLSEAIDSILCQTFKNFEFIIVNDASTDATGNILKDYSQKDNRIVLVQNSKHLEQSKSLNIGIGVSRGMYIAKIDADDIALCERLERQVNFLTNNPKIGLLGSYAWNIDENGNTLSEFKVLTKNNEIKNELLKSNQFIHSAVMFKKECISKVGSYREEIRCASDYDLWIRISEYFDVANLDNFLCKWRTHPCSLTNTKSIEQIGTAFLIKELYTKERQLLGNKRLLKSYFSLANTKAFGYLYRAEQILKDTRYFYALKTSLKAIASSPLNYKIWLYSYKLIIFKIIFSKIKRIIMNFLPNIFVFAFIPLRKLLRKKHIGLITTEFFHKNLGGYGGFGNTAKVISEFFQPKNDANLKISVLLSKKLENDVDKAIDVKNQHIYSIPNGNIGYVRRFLKDSLFFARNFVSLLSIDLFPSYEYFLNTIPGIPLLIWLRDPRSELEWRTIGSVKYELIVNGKENVQDLEMNSQRIGDFFLKLVNNKILKRKIVFVTNAQCFIPRAKRLYRLKKLEPIFLPNPINFPDFDNLKKSSKPTVCFMARLDPYKRPWIFLELAKRFDYVDFLVCGETHFPQLMEPIINNYKSLGNIKFLGVVEGEKKADVLSRSWVLVNSSIHEGLPCSFLEAFSHGRPVLSCVDPDGLVSRFGYFTGECLGDGFDELTIKRFQAGLESIFSNPGLFEKKGHEARKYIENLYNFKNFENGLMNILKGPIERNFELE